MGELGRDAMALPKNKRLIVGLKPWLPWPFSRWRWWTEPVRAERLAALRIVATMLVLPGLWTRKDDPVPPEMLLPPDGLMTVFSGLLVWLVAGAFLLLGLWKRLYRPLAEQDPHILPLVIVSCTVASLFL